MVDDRMIDLRMVNNLALQFIYFHSKLDRHVKVSPSTP